MVAVYITLFYIELSEMEDIVESEVEGYSFDERLEVPDSSHSDNISQWQLTDILREVVRGIWLCSRVKHSKGRRVEGIPSPS